MKLKEYLKENKIKITHFAKTLGKARKTIHTYLNGSIIPPLSVQLFIEQVTNGEVSRNDW